MSRREAPLHVRSEALAVWVLQHVGGWPAPMNTVLGRPAMEAATELVVAVSMALTFPRERPRWLAEVDRQLVRLRVLMRLARSAGLLRENSLRYAAEELRDIGRMTGGWRKRVERESSGEASLAATTG